MILWRWFTQWQDRRACFHHAHTTGTSWIESELVDLGRRKRFWCNRCGRVWLT